MIIGNHVQQWRLKRRLSMAEVEKRAQMAPGSLEALEVGDADPAWSTISSIAEVLGIPISWLCVEPGQIEPIILDHPEGESGLAFSADPVTEQILRAKHQKQELFYLMSALIVHGDPRLIQAAEANLKSLIKETQRSPIPWANRQPGNFDPPSD
jgi:transcriptional regulator with XRE-family HTH domain